jgi:hypothetical protein
MMMVMEVMKMINMMTITLFCMYANSDIMTVLLYKKTKLKSFFTKNERRIEIEIRINILCMKTRCWEMTMR